MLPEPKKPLEIILLGLTILVIAFCTIAAWLWLSDHYWDYVSVGDLKTDPKANIKIMGFMLLTVASLVSGIVLVKAIYLGIHNLFFSDNGKERTGKNENSVES